MKQLISRIAALAVCLIVMGVTTSGAAPPDKTPPRFVDNGDGTITDNQTALMWEKKTGIVGTAIFCSTLTTCADPSNVNNLYVWSVTPPAADGPLFTDFLAKMNCAISSSGACGAGPYSDWRVPTLAELRTICPVASPCIDPIFGPRQSGYWSSTTFAVDPSFAWNVAFNNGFVGGINKFDNFFARAVRGGR